MRLMLIFHGRFPGEKAGSLFAAKSAEAFADAGLDVVVLVPRRWDRVRKTPFEYWGIRQNFAVRYLPVVDFYSVPILRIVAFPVCLATFTLSVFSYLLFHRESRELVYSNEMIPLLFASFVARKTVLEVHDYPGAFPALWRLTFSRASLMIATNSWKAKALEKEFAVPRGRILVEQNAVDLEQFSPAMSRAAARAKLGLPESAKIVLYTGHLYDWKGADTLARAAALLPSAEFYFVGGTKEDIDAFKKNYGSVPNIRIIGFRPYQEIPLWQRAADVLVFPNSGKERISERYTSPMKLFEYMASGTPIVASDLPSVREIVGRDAVRFATPDDPASFADAMREVFSKQDETQVRAARARELVKNHSWRARAARILRAIEAASKA
ncbi:MAG: hypothetical protein RLZZ416_521 [Candidatus Parcubacteria bacterium]|jgi:glycosyltransferase involved in cell wall biosynthesis